MLRDGAFDCWAPQKSAILNIALGVDGDIGECVILTPLRPIEELLFVKGEIGTDLDVHSHLVLDIPADRKSGTFEPSSPIGPERFARRHYAVVAFVRLNGGVFAQAGDFKRHGVVFDKAQCVENKGLKFVAVGFFGFNALALFVYIGNFLVGAPPGKIVVVGIELFDETDIDDVNRRVPGIMNEDTSR